MDSISLHELASRVRGAIETLDAQYWVSAELAQVNMNQHSGHCYLDLVEKKDEKVAAQMRATIWKWVFGKLSAKFSLTTGAEMAAGMKVLLLVEVGFHDVYGMSLNVKDIDPAYTLGDMARKRRETIERLEKEGIFNKNKETTLPILPSRLAVVSSETAAGFGDFINTLKAGGYGFSVTLYPAFMQGAQAESSILEAFGAIKRASGDYDAVVLIRGGGSQVDLSYFDAYALAREIALFPLPVLVGIGHERDESVADMVAHSRLITPTAVAEFLVGRFAEFEGRVDDLAGRLIARSSEFIGLERHRLKSIAGELLSGSRALVTKSRHALHIAASGISSSARSIMADAAGSLLMLAVKLRSGSGAFVTQSRHHLAMNAGVFKLLAFGALKAQAVRVKGISEGLPRGAERVLRRQSEALASRESTLRLVDPINVLMRGYSITTKDGRAVTDSKTLKKGDILLTRLASGEARSVVDGLVDDTGKETDG